METTGTRREARQATGPRAQPPIRWPHPHRASVAVFGVWVVGLLVALVAPALVVSPNEPNASAAEVWTAFSLTVVGAAIMIGASVVLWKRTKDSGALVMGGVPAVSVVAGGVILAASKLTGI